jgi:hypothetical protein
MPPSWTLLTPEIRPKDLPRSFTHYVDVPRPDGTLERVYISKTAVRVQRGAYWKTMRPTGSLLRACRDETSRRDILTKTAGLVVMPDRLPVLGGPDA